MKTNSRKVRILIASLSILMVLSYTPYAIAEEINVIDNGAGSINTVTVDNTQQASSQQNNTAQINNSVSTTTDTGNNSASNNTGDSQVVHTGDVDTLTTISNSANQSNISDPSCCTALGGTTTINGNGAGSNNNASVSSSTQTSVFINNKVTIKNNITQNLSTGNNKTNFNSGNVVIKTGNIKSVTEIKNGPLNVANVLVSKGKEEAKTVKIFGNGFGSWNTVDVTDDDKADISVDNSVDFINDLKNKYYTGGNEADHNHGDVKIVTGDIESLINIINGPINVSIVKAECDTCEKEKEYEKEKEKEKEKPAPPVGGNVPPPTTTTTTGGPGGPSAPSAPVTLGGPHLPITGNNFLVLALFGNIMMLLLGAYLRLRSGRSPGYAFAL